MGGSHNNTTVVQRNVEQELNSIFENAYSGSIQLA